MNPKDILFSVNSYDSDGDIGTAGIFLHFGDTRVLAADSLDDFRTIIGCLESMIREIEENYPDEVRNA